jgi:hypothetical protein
MRKKKSREDVTSSAVTAIIAARTKLLEDFCSAYLAAHCKTEEEAKLLLNNIELVEDQSDPKRVTFYFQQRHGQKRGQH